LLEAMAKLQKGNAAKIGDTEVSKTDTPL